MNEISIRDAEERDAPAIASLCGQLGYPTPAEAVASRMDRLREGGQARVVVAVDGDSTVGLATIHLRHMINHEAPIGQLTLLVVDERVRGQGVGRLLVAESEAWARARGCKRFVVTTALRRTEAHAFYEKLGFVHTGRRYGKDFS
ncbi:MAG TPA: GNAT family N-acetyltransferase [Gemmatimonadaceae bacterium]|nr:GNAT family N-acetyltransferase [Gemmatimonadaceae bacterium]